MIPIPHKAQNFVNLAVEFDNKVSGGRTTLHFTVLRAAVACYKSCARKKLNPKYINKDKK